jgi:hypothetical protein
MAVKQGEPRIIGHKIDLNATEAFNKDRIFENSRGCFPVDFRDLEIMPMQMQGVHVFADKGWDKRRNIPKTERERRSECFTALVSFSAAQL